MEFTKDGEIENYDLQDGKLDLECITPYQSLEQLLSPMFSYIC